MGTVDRMDVELANFLSRYHPLTEENAVWGDGLLPLRITSYLGDGQAPARFVTSVRAIVLRGDSILVVRDSENTFHITPGGRREEGESMEATLKREILEETGWAIGEPSLIGYLHLHHLAPRPVDYAYPHPDFMQLIYVADAAEFIPAAKLPGQYEVESSFRSLAEVNMLELSPSQRVFLQAALKKRNRRQPAI